MDMGVAAMMSSLFDQACKSTNERVRGKATYAPGSRRGRAHLLVVALDYTGTPHQCQSTNDARNMEHLAELCGVSCVSLYNDGCKRRLVCEAIQASGRRCGPEDTLVIYYAGYARRLQDDDGDEADGLDEALVLYDDRGELSEEGLLRDDDFSRLVAEACSPETSVLIIADCNNSGTVADLNSAVWRDRRAISISACRDSQVAGAATGGGGIFTHSVLLAIDRLGRLGEAEYSVGLLFNAALKEDDDVFDSKQDFTIQALDSCQPDSMPWPLIPPGTYDSPLREVANKTAGGPDSSGKDVMTRDVAVVEAPSVDDEPVKPPPTTIFGRWALCCGVELPSQTEAAVLVTTMVTTGVVSADVLKDANLQRVVAAIDPSYLVVVQGMDLILNQSRGYCQVCPTM